jgi:hypothetical protein
MAVSARRRDHGQPPGEEWELVGDRLVNYLRSDRYDIWQNVPSSQGPVKYFIIDRYEKDDGDKGDSRGHVTPIE